MCSICGQPNFLRCNCLPAQPFCDQCANDSICVEKVDSQCVIYHFATSTYTPPATRLINMGLPNGSSAETIFERIDTLFGFSKPWVPGDTQSIHMHADGPGLPVTLRGDVKISATAGNIISSTADGLFVPAFFDDGKVKVNALGVARYLADSITGGTDGCVSLTPSVNGGILALIPSIDLNCFTNRVCASDPTLKSALLACLLEDGLEVVDSSTIDFTLTPGNPSSLTADVKISTTAGNTLVINGNGLFVPAPVTPGFTINNNVDNRLITANGTANSADAEATLLYDATIGTLNAPVFTPILPATNPSFVRSSFSAGLNFNQANYGVKVGNLGGVLGGIQYDAQTNTTFGRGYFIGGIISEPVFNTTNGSTSTGILASIVAKTDIFGNGIYTSIANIRTSYPSTDTSFGGVFSGSITNYYALFIGDTNTDEGGITPVPTNKYAIFQEGSTLKNSFATAIVVTSDERIKTNIEKYNEGLGAIEQINTVKYHFKEDVVSNKKIGVLAQDIEKIIPEAIHTENNDFYGIKDFKKLDTDVLIYTLINAVQELSAQNKALNARLLALEGKA